MISGSPGSRPRTSPSCAIAGMFTAFPLQLGPSGESSIWPQRSNLAKRAPTMITAPPGSNRGNATSEYQAKLRSISACDNPSCRASSISKMLAPRPVTPPPTPIANTPPPAVVFHRCADVESRDNSASKGQRSSWTSRFAARLFWVARSSECEALITLSRGWRPINRGGPG